MVAVLWMPDATDQRIIEVIWCSAAHKDIALPNSPGIFRAINRISRSDPILQIAVDCTDSYRYDLQSLLSSQPQVNRAGEQHRYNCIPGFHASADQWLHPHDLLRYFRKFLPPVDCMVTASSYNSAASSIFQSGSNDHLML